MPSPLEAQSDASPLTPDEHAVVARIVDAAPPLSESQKARLSALLRPGRPDHFTNALRSTIAGAR